VRLLLRTLCVYISLDVQMTIVYLLLTVVVVTVGVAFYSGTGGRAWFGTTEHPDRLLGRTVQLKDCDGLGSISLPAATVSTFHPPEYRLDFAVPVELDGRSETFVRVRSRHTGYPVSDAARRSTWVGATLHSGRGFIARLEVC